MTDRPTASRRLLLAALPAALATTLASRAGAQALLPGSASLLVPGPEGGLHARWAERLAQAIAASAPTAVRLQADILGGADGVTAANRFATEAAPDGRSLLVLAGAAAQARLAGDSRAKFDNAGWLPVCASLGCAVVVGRGPRPQRAGAQPLAVAVGAPEGSGAAALLAMDLLGLPATPLAGNPTQLWQDGKAAALLLSGPAVPSRLAAMGAEPWFVLDAGPGEHDPALPDVPTLADLAPAQAPALLAACRAAGAAARLLAGLVLPALTPADQVALWRNAVQRWLEEETRGGGAIGLAMPGAEAAAVMAAMSPGPEAVLAYREWLLRRLGWQAG
jgi:hypothetical protein